MKNPQELANAIKELAKSKQVTIRKMLSECGLSINTLSSMQSGGYFPRLEAITRIADYLDCSVDYLLGRTDNPAINASSKLLYSDICQQQISENVGNVVIQHFLIFVNNKYQKMLVT
nr:MAG TPA: repressor protein [Caudoviricetes sp.]